MKLGRERYDLAFIDACHAEKWVLHDFEKVKKHCRWVAFHDIVLPGATVDRAWRKIKARHDRQWEFIDRTLGQTLGIGVIELKKSAPRKRPLPALRGKS
jgi:predicted O-methyltransferase YrrM